MKNTIKISLSADSILYFPIYLLAADPIAYGLNDVRIKLESKDSDKAALEALNDGFHFAICDPIYLRDHKGIKKKAIKPLIIKSALWISSPLNTTLKSSYGIKYIVTHPKDTTAYNCAQLLRNRSASVELNKYSFRINEESEIKDTSFGDEFQELQKLCDTGNTIMVTSDIIQLISKNSNYIGLYDLDIKEFKKNVFTALISHKILLERNDTLVEKIVKAIDSVLISFKNTKDDEYTPIAKKLFNYLLKEKKSIIDNCNIQDIARVLEALHKSKIYPSEKTVNSLHLYWRNSCEIKDEGNKDV